MKTLAITFTFLFFTLIATAQTVHTVDNRSQSGAMFTNLQTAVDAAVAGDIIHIHPSTTNYGVVNIDKQLKLIGLGHNPTTHTEGITAKINSIRFRASSANSIVTGLTIGGISVSSAVPLVDVDNIHIIHNKITGSISANANSGMNDGWIIEGNYFTSPGRNVYTRANGWLVRSNFLQGYIERFNVANFIINNIFMYAGGSTTKLFFNNFGLEHTLVSNNIFITNGATTEIGINNCDNINMRNNITYSYSGLTINALPGVGNLDNTNPLFLNLTTANFTDFYNNDYHLNMGSPGHNYGTDGTDVGVYGNGFLFDMQGRPDLQPYPIDVIINNNVIAPGQPLSVRFTAAQKN